MKIFLFSFVVASLLTGCSSDQSSDTDALGQDREPTPDYSHLLEE